MGKKKKSKNKNEAKKISKEFLNACYYMSEHSMTSGLRECVYKIDLRTGWYVQWDPRTDSIELCNQHKEVKAQLFTIFPSSIAMFLEKYLRFLRL